MKEQFETTKIEVVNLNSEDVIVTSNTGEWD